MRWSWNIFIIFPLLHTIYCDNINNSDSTREYLIWLKGNLTNGLEGREYLQNHFNLMKKMIPSFRLKYKYSNLAMYGFLVYSVSIHTNDWERYIQLANIKFVEDITSNYRIAEQKGFPIEYIPYVPYSLDPVAVSKDEDGLCTVTYEYLAKLQQDQDTLHAMVIFYRLKI